jgi:hypothetical protein
MNSLAHHKPVTKHVAVLINGAKVTLPEKEITGASIIEAGIAAGLPIQTDFVLYARREGEYTKIEPGETITVHTNEKFRAVAPDDVA